MITYLYGYTFTGIDENNALSGSKIDVIYAENDEKAFRLAEDLKDIRISEFEDIPTAKCTIDFIYKKESEDLRYEYQKVTANVAEKHLNSQKSTNTSNNISEDEAIKILNKIIDFVANDEKDEEATIKKLINMGFSGESLVDHFGFNMMSVSEVLEEMQEKGNRTS